MSSVRTSVSRVLERLGLRSAAVRGGATLVTGTILAQAVMLAVTPLLARAYDPEAFGYLSLALAVSSMVAPAACLKLDSALLLPRSPQRATALFFAGAASSLLISVAVALTLSIAFQVGFLPELARLPHFAVWAAVLVFFTASFSLVSQLALRGEGYAIIARRSLYQAVVTAVGQLSLSVFLPVGGLVAGQTMGRLAGVLPVLNWSRGLLAKFRPRVLVLSVKKYWKFPVIFAPSALLNAAGLGLPLIYVGVRYGVESAGQWGMADRLLAAPVLLVGLAVGQVMEARLASHQREGARPLAPMVLKSLRYLVTIGATLAIGIWIFADSLLSWLLGVGWEESITLVGILVLSTSVRLVAGPVSKVLVVLQRAGANLALDASRVALLLCSFGLATWCDFSIDEAAVAITVALALVYLITILVSWRAVTHYDSLVRGPGGTVVN